MYTITDLLGVIHAGVLVHRTAGEEQPVLSLGLPGPPQCVLDDWFLQPPGLPDRHEAGGDTGTSWLGTGLCAAA